ncbi:CLUMA_CG000322, isoform A [Clunio marinus]|uniref:CLUMA_CG000322, isoform A n=1 Tax=Clunio marinus TaxID=568069 RepID=A0A1J1HIU9_9DIPT|nr:CLUMA_CG000322, isoform A [Clunio marinus]
MARKQTSKQQSTTWHPGACAVQQRVESFEHLNLSKALNSTITTIRQSNFTLHDFKSIKGLRW